MGNKVESVKKTETGKVAPKPAPKKTKATPAKAVVKTSAGREKSEENPARKAASQKKTAVASPTHDEIALHAYFIAEKRHKLGIPGNTANDWLEAERQLLARRKSKNKAVKQAG